MIQSFGSAVNTVDITEICLECAGRGSVQETFSYSQGEAFDVICLDCLGSGLSADAIIAEALTLGFNPLEDNHLISELVTYIEENTKCKSLPKKLKVLTLPTRSEKKLQPSRKPFLKLRKQLRGLLKAVPKLTGTRFLMN